MRGRGLAWGLLWVMKILSSWVAVTQTYQLSELTPRDPQKCVPRTEAVTPGHTETHHDSTQACHAVSRTVQPNFLAIKNSQSMVENSSCLLSAKSMPIKATEQTPHRASFLSPLTYFPDK